MANPQTENGYIKIATEIFEALCAIRIPGEARQCLDVIIRKTYGFHKKEDIISLSQFCLLSNMTKDDVCRSLRKLAQINIIIVKKDNQNITSYRFNKDFDTWKPLSKKTILSNMTIGIVKKDNRPLSNMTHTIDNITKDTITKDNIVADATKKEFNFDSYKTAMLNNANLAIKIIAGYWIAKGFTFTNAKQASAAIARELRPANALTGYELKKIGDTMRWLKQNADFKWTLESVGKFIDEDLSEIEKKQNKIEPIKTIEGKKYYSLDEIKTDLAANLIRWDSKEKKYVAMH